MRTLGRDHPYEITATAPYVASLSLAGDAFLHLALPGIGEMVLAGPSASGEASVLELIPPSSTWSSDPTINPAGRAALAAWRFAGGQGALVLRHEKGLGGDTGLGDRIAALAAGAVAGAALAGGTPDRAQMNLLLADMKPLRPEHGAGALAAAMKGGAFISSRQGHQPVALNHDLGVVVVLPGQGAAKASMPPKPGMTWEVFQRALEGGELGALVTHVLDATPSHEPWRKALDAAMQAGADWAGVAAGGRALLALTRTIEGAMPVRTAAIDAFAEDGIWSRGRAGPINRRGAQSISGARQP